MRRFVVTPSLSSTALLLLTGLLAACGPGTGPDTEPKPKPKPETETETEMPIALDQSVSTHEGLALIITLSGSAPEGVSLTFALVEQPEHGTTSNFEADSGTLTYTPDENFNGTDSFTFTVSDGTATSEPATVSITISAVNHAPTAADQSVSTPEDTPTSIVLSASDVDGDPLTYIVGDPDHGTLSGTPPDLTYTPDADYNGSDSFTFTVSDGTATSEPATVSITITPVNDAPTAADQSVSTPEDTPTSIVLSASDVDGDPLTYIVGDPDHGTLSGTPPDLTYTPDADYNGSDSFTFTVSDGTATSEPATVSITITSVNDAPTAASQSVNTPEDTATSIVLSATDVDGDELTYIVSAPDHGTLSGTPPDLTYTPDADYNGSDSFTFTVSDGTATSEPATVSITITPVNDAPTAASQSVHTPEDTPTSIVLSASDVDGDPLTYIVGDPDHGTLSGTPPDLTYTPDADYNGNDSFTFTVSDGTATSEPATVSITITPVNDAPTAASQVVHTPEDTPTSIVLSASDVDGDPLTYIVGDPDHGTLSGTPPDLTYTPDADYNGNDSFTFTVSDGTATSEPATVSITITPVNDAPTAASQVVHTPEDTPTSIVLSASDVDGDPLTYIVGDPDHGTLSGTPPNLTYTPDQDYNGSDSFTFVVSDGEALSNVAVVEIVVEPVPDAPVITAFNADRTAVIYGEPVTFSWEIHNPDGIPLTCRLDANGDGTNDYTISNCDENGSQFWLYRNITTAHSPVLSVNGTDSATLSEGIAVEANRAVFISAGYFYSLARKADGTVVHWGIPVEGAPPPGLNNVMAVATGWSHSLALKNDGTLVAWGVDLSTAPAGLENVFAIAADNQRGVALHSLHSSGAGAITSWGVTDLGLGFPPLGLLGGAVDIAAGALHSVGVRPDGRVFAWGSNNHGQATAPYLTEMVAVAAGTQHSLALKADGTVVGWGDDYFGQATVPPDLHDVVAIDANGFHSLALKADGTVVGWGDIDSPPSGLSDVIEIAAGVHHALALRSDGTVVGWGADWGGMATPPSGLKLFP